MRVLVFGDRRRGRVVTPAALEALAVQWRAGCGVVPYWLWAAMSPESRGRLAAMTQTRARRMLPRPTSIIGVALADLFALGAAA